MKGDLTVRKLLLSITLAVTVSVVTACLDSDEEDTERDVPEDERVTDEDQHVEEDESEEALSWITSSMEAMQQLNSFEVSMSAEQRNRRNINTSYVHTETTQWVSKDPFAYHEIATMTDPNDEELERTFETYLHETEGFYIYEPNFETWMHMPDETLQSMNSLQNYQDEQQLTILLDYLVESSLSMEENDDETITITAIGDTETVNEQGEQISDVLQGGFGLMMDDLQSLLTIQSLNYELTIDRESKYLESFSISIELFISPEQGAQIHANQQLDLTYDRHNEIDPITIPDFVKEEAEPVQIDTEAFQNMQQEGTE